MVTESGEAQAQANVPMLLLVGLIAGPRQPGRNRIQTPTARMDGTLVQSDVLLLAATDKEGDGIWGGPGPGEARLRIEESLCP